MKTYRKALLAILLVVVAYSVGISSATAANYRSLEGVKGLDVVYDFRLTDPRTAALFLKLMHETYLDTDIRDMIESPRFVVVVNGAAIKLIAKDQPGYSAEDQVYIEEIAGRIALMAADGIRIEGCLKAAEIFGVDQDLFLSEINKIGNAWISIAGYQTQRFAALSIN
jgi:intracellular sulfur oxidation DsrE/DsrF family protein